VADERGSGHCVRGVERPSELLTCFAIAALQFIAFFLVCQEEPAAGRSIVIVDNRDEVASEVRRLFVALIADLRSAPSTSSADKPLPFWRVLEVLKLVRARTGLASHHAW
jgi:hypothetical protein